MLLIRSRPTGAYPAGRPCQSPRLVPMFLVHEPHRRSPAEGPPGAVPQSAAAGGGPAFRRSHRHARAAWVVAAPFCARDRARLRPAQPQGRGAGRQFAGRLARAVLAAVPPYPPTRRGEGRAGGRLRRRCGGLRRLLARARGGRSVRRRDFAGGIDRRHHRELRLRRRATQARRAAPPLYRGREQVAARSLPHRGSQGGRAPDLAAARHA